MNRRRQTIVLSGAGHRRDCCVAGIARLRPSEADDRAKRARPPKWSADVLDAFFRGCPREARRRRGPITTGDDRRRGQPIAGFDSTATACRSHRRRGWSKLIDAETIETEIKRLAQAVAQGRDDAERSSKAAATRIAAGTSACWPRCSPSPPSTTATFAGRMRRRRLRDLFARAGHNCKVGTDQTFQEAHAAEAGPGRPRRRHRGRKLPQAERKADWAQVADRPPLMQRMNIAHEDRLTKWLANEREFNAPSRRRAARSAARRGDRRRDRPRRI